MKKASVSEAKNTLSALIDGLANGTPVLIVDRGRPVARLEPVGSGERSDDEGRIARLVRQGMVRAGRGTLSKTILNSAPPKPTAGASAIRVLLDERRSGR
jgi:prevent-host-death family protein